MSVELQADGGAARPASAHETALEIEPRDLRRPDVFGDLPTLFQAAPMFRRAVAGYDRFQVDTYVQWAEDELATTARAHEHLMARHVGTRAALAEARELLAHSAGGGEFLQVSRRIGSMLAAAADEAEGMRAEAESVRAAAEADRAAACAQAEQMVAHAEQVITDAGTEAERMLARAATEAEATAVEAGRIVDEAQQAAREIRAEAAAALAKARSVEQRAAEHADEVRRQAAVDASAARLQARDEVVRMLGTAREQRRRADAEAATVRERLDRDVALLAEVATLERRRVALRAEIDLLAGAVGAPARDQLDVHLRRLVGRLRWRSGSLRAP
jgi:cell division septum initiation protein DivIVA